MYIMDIASKIRDCNNAIEALKNIMMYENKVKPILRSNLKLSWLVIL